jgi:Domain of unknown function (DUF4209)
MSSSIPSDLSPDELGAIADALTGRPDWLTLARALEKVANERSSVGLRIVSIAFVYDFVPQSQRDRRVTADGPYATMWEGPEGTYPPRVSEVLDEVRALWRSVLDAMDDPIVCSRLADLLYVAEGGSAHAEGRRAARCFVELTRQQGWQALDRAECMSRALEIYTELNDQDALSDCASRGVALVDELLGQEHAGPPFIALRALLVLKPKSRPADLPDLLERVIEHYKNTRHEAAALGLAADATKDPQRKADLRRRQLAAKVREAQGAEGIAKVALLSKAIEFARQHGLSPEANELLKELQDMPQSELGLQPFEVSTELPVDEIREEIDRLGGSGANDLFDALRRIGAGIEPPGGSNADIDAEVENQNREFPLLNLFGQTILGAESAAPHFVAYDKDNKLRAARGRQRRIHTDFVGGVFIGPLLDVAAEHHGRPSHEELTTYFATELIGEDRAERIARALELFWDGEYDTSAHVIVPRLESILRDLARARGITIVKHVSEGTYGGVTSLNTIMAKLRALDPDVEWLDYLEALLCDPLALNLRNVIAHGLATKVGGISAALLLHAACFLALLKPVQADEAQQPAP